MKVCEAFEEIKFAGMLLEYSVGEEKYMSATVLYPYRLTKKKDQGSTVNLSTKLFDSVDVPFNCFWSMSPCLVRLWHWKTEE